MDPMGSLLLIVLLGAASCQNDRSEDVLQGYNSNPYPMVGCYFPAEMQGEFVTQVGGMSAGGILNEPIQYSTINITFNSIPIWGYCHKKIKDKVLLKDRYGDKDCIRCFRLLQRSRNVIELFSEAFNSCYIFEKAALNSCNTLNSISILYRTKEIGGVAMRYEYCPIVGLYYFKYNIDDGSMPEYNTYSSEFNNCPEGSVLHWKFIKRNITGQNFTYTCLGSWPGSNGSNYIALYDGNANSSRPQYRCGLFHVDNKKGKTYMAFSSDSSCSQQLYNSTSGYETLILSKNVNGKKVPDSVSSRVAAFPKWAQGYWEDSVIINGTMTFIDHNGYNSFTFITVDAKEQIGRFSVYSKDQCEQSAFVCVMMRQRSENVMEFTIGHSPAITLNPSLTMDSICDDPIIDEPIWMTQARVDRAVESPCPITGRYMGMITDLLGMCAELTSNCKTREIMYFRVSDCESGELYEERTYLCLGQWEENGVMYTYTMRNDTYTDMNECFVGLIVNEDEIYIKEAGDHCMRDIDPRKQGMRLSRRGICNGTSASPTPTPIKPIPHDPIMRITTPRSKISGATQVPGNAVSSSGPCRSSICINLVLLTISIAFLKAGSLYRLG